MALFDDPSMKASVFSSVVCCTWQWGSLYCILFIYIYIFCVSSFVRFGFVVGLLRHRRPRARNKSTFCVGLKENHLRLRSTPSCWPLSKFFIKCFLPPCVTLKLVMKGEFCSHDFLGFLHRILVINGKCCKKMFLYSSIATRSLIKLVGT